MTDEQLLLKRAANEISELRMSNQLMAARLEVFDKMILMFTTEPNFPRHGESIDIVWEINKAIEVKPEPPKDI